MLTATAIAALPSAAPTSDHAAAERAHGLLRELLQLPGSEVVDTRDEDAVLGAARELPRRARRFLRLQAAQLVLERAHLLGEALDAVGHLLRAWRSRSPARRSSCSSNSMYSNAPSPVIASMRRRFEPIEPSLTTLIGPMNPSACTWVPPHSSVDGPGFEHAHDVAVLLAEERDRADALGLGLGRLVVPDRRVGDHLRVRQPLDLRELVGGHGLVMREVEAQTVGADERTRLLHVRAEHLAQRPVQHVRGGVVAADAVAAHAVDLGQDLVALDDDAGAHPRPVHRHLTGQAVLRVE